MNYITSLLVILGIGNIIADLIVRGKYYFTMQPGILFVMGVTVDSIVLIAALIGFALKKKWGVLLLLASSFVGFAREMVALAPFVSGESLVDPLMVFAAHTTGNTIFRLLCIALAIDSIKETTKK